MKLFAIAIICLKISYYSYATGGSSDIPLDSRFRGNDNQNFKSTIDKALTNLQKHKSFEVNFNQEFYSILRDKITVSEGLIKIEAPGSFKFELQKPRNELYVSNGKDFWKYIPDLKHAQHLNANTLELNYISLLTNAVNIKTVYKISRWTNADAVLLKEPRDLPLVKSDYPPAESAENVSIKLEPKRDKQQKVLYAILNVRRGILEELRVVQLNGNRVRLLFSNDKDKVFDDKTFSFLPPQGIVVDSN